MSGWQENRGRSVVVVLFFVSYPETPILTHIPKKRSVEDLNDCSAVHYCMSSAQTELEHVLNVHEKTSAPFVFNASVGFVGEIPLCTSFTDG